MLSPGQTIATSFSTQHIATLLGAKCCVRLATLLLYFATCWVLLAQIWKWPNFSCNICRWIPFWGYGIDDLERPDGEVCKTRKDGILGDIKKTGTQSSANKSTNPHSHPKTLRRIAFLFFWRLREWCGDFGLIRKYKSQVNTQYLVFLIKLSEQFLSTFLSTSFTSKTRGDLGPAKSYWP